MAVRKLSKRNREVFLEGLKRFQERGVPILIDGKEADASAWERILEEQSDGSFYMGDYILEEYTPGSCVSESCVSDEKNEVLQNRQENMQNIVRESSAEYTAAGSGLDGRRLKEIRFDRVYNR